MNSDLLRLMQVAQKPIRHIVGLMSGTSLDCLDVALCRFEGSGSTAKVSVLNFRTVPYTAAQRNQIGQILLRVGLICKMSRC